MSLRLVRDARESSTVSSCSSRRSEPQLYAILEPRHIIFHTNLTDIVPFFQALSVSSYVLGLTGYVTPSRETVGEQIADVQPDSVIMALRIMTGPVPAVMLFISLLVSWFYPLDKELVMEMQGELRERRRLIAKAEVELGESEKAKNNDTVY
jgi:hypothetical protein